MVRFIPRKRGNLLSVAVAIGASLMVTGACAQFDEDKSYLDLASQFCDYGAPVSHFGNKDYCGFVDEYNMSKEYNETIAGTGCYDCGTANGGCPFLALDGNGNGEGVVLWPGGGTGAGYDQSFSCDISLYCTGAVNVQAIYQVIPSEYQDIYGIGGAGLDERSFTRCSLGTGDNPAPVEEATNCVSCHIPDDKPAAEGCPQLNVGEWYVDTAVVSLGDSCPPFPDLGDYPMTTGVYTDAGMKLNLTSFTATQADGYSKPDFGFHPCFVHSGCDTGIEWLDEHDGDGYSPGWYCADGVVSDTCDINPDCVNYAGEWMCGESESGDEHTFQTHQREAEGR